MQEKLGQQKAWVAISMCSTAIETSWHNSTMCTPVGEQASGRQLTGLSGNRREKNPTESHRADAVARRRTGQRIQSTCAVLRPAQARWPLYISHRITPKEYTSVVCHNRLCLSDGFGSLESRIVILEYQHTRCATNNALLPQQTAPVWQSLIPSSAWKCTTWGF